jgi:hypothetical protein
MADQFRTSVSLVFWTADAESAQAEIDAIRAALPEESQPAVLSTIEFVAAGKPEPPVDPLEADSDGG